MTTTDISRNNGTDRLLVSANSPLFDLLHHMAETYTDPLMLIEDLVNYRAHVEDAIDDAVRAAKTWTSTRPTASWEGIGRALGTSRQAAWERYGPRA